MLRRLARPAAARLAALGSAVGCRGAAMGRREYHVEAEIDWDEQGKIKPHGGWLRDLMVKDEQLRADLKASCDGKAIECSDRNACDVELLMVGGFSPLEGFMDEGQYHSVIQDMRLPGSTLLFGLPIVLDTSREDIQEGQRVLLQYHGQDLAVLDVETKWKPNKPAEARHCYGTTSIEHPGVKMLAMERGCYYIGGRVHGFELPHRIFPCSTPQQVRDRLPEMTDVVAFQCRNPVHRAHYELFMKALQASNVREGAVCLVHPTVGPTQDDDVPGDIRYRTYEVLKEEVADPRVLWEYLPYSMHMAGPREAIQHMIVRKNYGCTHFIIGRDMAGSKSCLTGEDFYGPYDAQHMAREHAEELGMRVVPSQNVVYTREKGYVTDEEARAEGLSVMKLSGTKFRQMLRSGEEIPPWFAFESVVKVLRELYVGR
ncbi:unnamed protein product [Pedinophyceae sp. YPF-701]|nr:unnamed protein product [Pedinophyceae sp. YPF-701]